MVAERDDLPRLGGLGQVGVAVDEVVRAGVLGEEGQHGPGALGPRGDVVLFQHRIAAPVHDGVEVQVEDRLFRGGQPAADHLLVQGGQEPLLVIMRQPVGVIGEHGFLRQRRHPGEQPCGGVGQQVIDMGDPPGPGELERQQGQQPVHGGDDPGAWVASCADQGGQVQGHQVGDGQQQPCLRGLQPVRPGGQVDDPGRGQAGVPAGGGRGDAGLRIGAAQQPPEPLLGQDLTDRRPVERGALGGQPPGDLIGRQALPAQLDDPAARAVLGGRHAGWRTGLLRRGEQLQRSRPVLTDQVDHRPPGVAEPGAGLLTGQVLGEEGAQRLVPLVVHLRRGGEPLGLLLRRSGCHTACLPDLHLAAALRGRPRFMPMCPVCRF